MSRFFAHTRQEKPPEEWEPLEDHLRLVAGYARQFAEEFQAGAWGETTGLWHDLGKYSREFQQYLLRSSDSEGHLEQYKGKVDHSTAGAKHAAGIFRDDPRGRILAYCIAGHHAGLADAMSAEGESGLDQRLKKEVPKTDDAPSDLLQKPSLPNPALSLQHQDGSRFQFQLSLFTRMLFSSLVDADFLATEEFMSPDRGSLRPTAFPSFDQLAGQLSEFLNGLGAGRSDRVGQARADVLSACKSAATLHPGLFSLTVPTGGGKTLSSLAFALEHACQHGMSRIIYAIPFTSIIEQTAAVFRQVFDGFPEETVVEHHSNTDPELDKERVASRLATENWRAPLIVTTNVQLFESLFASRTSRCRKLHNICNSVIILDEVQTIPIELLTPTLAVIRELVADYGCTIVLCTATQPTLNRSSEFPIGLEGVREIIPDPASLYAALRRVTVRHLGSQSDAAICNLLKQHSQFLCIVNTRPHAARLFQQTQDSLAAGMHGSLDHAPSADTSCFHLSTRMCAQHRMDILQVIRQRLTDGLPCQVISTQLIEAGVDVDFPVVYRSLSGIDSIAQAAGRCNREGKLTTGDVFVFEPTDVRLLGYLRSVADSAQELLVDLDANDMDLLSQETVSRYFQLHFMKHEGRWDQRRVMECFPSGSGKNHCRFNFRIASDRFRWIADTTETVFVPYGRGRWLIEKLRHVPTDRPDLLRPLIRRLQRFSVGLYDHVFRSMVGTDIEVLSSGYAVLMNDTCYDQQLGFNADVRGFHEPDSLIV